MTETTAPTLALKEWIPAPAVCSRYGKSRSWLYRAMHDPKLGFPKPMRLGERAPMLFKLSEIKRWEDDHQGGDHGEA